MSSISPLRVTFVSDAPAGTMASSRRWENVGVDVPQRIEQTAEAKLRLDGVDVDCGPAAIDALRAFRDDGA